MEPDLSPRAASDASLSKLRQYQHTLQDYSRLLASYIPVERLLPLTALRLARGVGVHHTKILRYDDTRGDLLMEAGVGWSPGAIGMVRFGIDASSPPGRTYQTRRPLAIGDLPGNPEYRYAGLIREHGIVSLANAPIFSGSTVWGVLEMDSAQPQRFDEDDTRFLQAMANILGVAIERAADQQAARNATAAAAAALAAETKLKGFQLVEMQHRMKNNLAVISSMLLLEQRQHSDARVKARLRALMDRVMAIGLAHDQLSLAGEEAMVDLATYLAQLTDNLAFQYAGIHMETELKPLAVPMDQAVPLGLIINELITNAAKYAFPDGRGAVRLELHGFPDLGENMLAVSDDGVGLGPPRAGGLGTMLLDGLAGQIGGVLTRPTVQRGTRVEIRFPIMTKS